MENHGFESAFSAEYRAQQRRLAWKYLGLIALAVVAVTLLRTHLLLGGVWRLIDLALPGLILLLDLSLAVLHRGQQRWMARRFKLTGRGILVQGRRGKEEIVPWSSIVTVDTGTLAGFGQRSVPVLRCFLSSSAWEKFTPNLRQSSEKTSMQDYYKLRKECFAMEYSPEREQTVLSLWESLGGDERDEPIENPDDDLSPDENFEFAFAKDIADVGPAFLQMLLVVFGLILLAIPVIWLLNPTEEDNLTGAIWLVFLCLFSLALFNIERPAMVWLRTKCKLSRDGIYVQHKKNKTEFVPWTDIVEIKRGLMSVARYHNLPVICCYRSLAAKTTLDFRPKQENLGQKYQEYYGLRDEIITFSYTKEKMHRIRAFHRAATKKK